MGDSPLRQHIEQFTHVLQARLGNGEATLRQVLDEEKNTLFRSLEAELERQVAECTAELQASEARFRKTFEYAPIGIAIVASDGRWVDANRALCETLGYTKAELLGTTFQALTHPEDVTTDMHNIQRLLHGEVSSFRREKHYVHKQGHTVQVIEYVFLVRDVQETPVHLVAQTQDDAERIPAEVVLEENEGQLRILVDITERRRAETWVTRLIDTTQDAVIAIDRQSGIVLFNPAAEQIFGYTSPEVEGQHMRLLMPEPYASEHDSYVERYERTHVPRAIGRVRVVSAQRKTGEVFPIELSITEVSIDGGVRYVAFIRDVSERMRLQEQLLDRERLATIGTIAAKLVHEIGNPLNGMAVATQLLERRLGKLTEDEAIQTSVRALRNQTTRLANLLDEFRSLSRRQSFTFRPTKLTEVIRDVLNTEMGLYTERGIAVEQAFSEGLPLVTVDQDKLKQVLLNLCKNAVEAMSNGGTLTLRAQNSGEFVEIEIADTGTGIPDGVNIFEPFITTKRGGTGLGLFIARQIIAAHGGTLTYRSERGKGTTFVIALPVKTYTDPQLLRNGDGNADA